jgi:PAS domain S-box-containing protein
LPQIMTVHKVLFVEDRSDRVDLIRSAFHRAGGEAVPVFVLSLQEALAFLRQESAMALFLNGRLSGSEITALLRERDNTGQRELPIILIVPSQESPQGLQPVPDGIDNIVADEQNSINLYPLVAQHAALRRASGRLRAEHADAIVRSQKQWMSIIDAITDYIFVIDEQHRLVRVNSSFATAFRMHPRDVAGKKCSELFGADLLGDCAQEDLRYDDKPRTFEKVIGGETYQISIFPLREGDRCLTIHVMKNITEIRRLKEQLHHADKLASIGLLVSGVAHELNNPLTGTIAYTELLGMKVSDQGIKQELTKILESAERCKKIVDNLLTFSRQRAPSKSLESINDIVDRAIDLRNYWLRASSIEVVKDYDPVSTVFVDSQQLQQVMLNLLLNAEQAIVGSGQKRGKITFTTRSDKENQRILVRITDNGPGIPPQTMSRIFDPFFTTKPVGVGTGLGLSISHGIITEHGGTIYAENREEGGAAFTVELPTGAGSPKAAFQLQTRKKKK